MAFSLKCSYERADFLYYLFYLKFLAYTYIISYYLKKVVLFENNFFPFLLKLALSYTPYPIFSMYNILYSKCICVYYTIVCGENDHFYVFIILKIVVHTKCNFHNVIEKSMLWVHIFQFVNKVLETFYNQKTNIKLSNIGRRCNIHFFYIN